MKALCLLPLFCVSTLLAQEPDSSSALFGMREAERNFARSSVMFGRNAAFVENLADEAILFTDKWITNGKQASINRKPSPFILKWEPEFMDIADSRDFGVSTGPWEIQEYRPNTAALATGYFLTAWKKQSDGKWKVILDGGSSTPVPGGPKHMFSFPSGADKVITNPPVMDVEQLKKDLLNMDSRFQAQWEKSHSAFISFPEARIQFNGHLPTANSDTIRSLYSKLDKSIIWQSSGAGAASSGDMGFTYGLIIQPGKPEKTSGHYVRIWKKQPGTDWKIIVEMINAD